MTFDTTTIIIVVAILAVLILAFLLARPRKTRVELAKPDAQRGYVASRDRPYVRPAEGKGVTGVAAAATTDVAGEVLNVDAHSELSGRGAPADDFERLKGVGPKLATRLRELGVSRYQQLADMTETEVALLDERLGPFRGRLARDRIAEQASYLARGDIEGFEDRFGKLGAS